jgi:hypothetical protein
MADGREKVQTVAVTAFTSRGDEATGVRTAGWQIQEA